MTSDTYWTYKKCVCLSFSLVIFIKYISTNQTLLFRSRQSPPPPPATESYTPLPPSQCTWPDGEYSGISKNDQKSKTLKIYQSRVCSLWQYLFFVQYITSKFLLLHRTRREAILVSLPTNHRSAFPPFNQEDLQDLPFPTENPRGQPLPTARLPLQDIMDRRGMSFSFIL